VQLHPDDILEAIREAEFDEFVEPIKEALVAFKTVVRALMHVISCTFLAFLHPRLRLVIIAQRINTTDCDDSFPLFLFLLSECLFGSTRTVNFRQQVIVILSVVHSLNSILFLWFLPESMHKARSNLRSKLTASFATHVQR
jgi:hypothetical protein